MSLPRYQSPDRLSPKTSQPTRRFLNVAEAATMLRLSQMTLYRAIHADEFPAVRIRGRYLVPAQAIEEMISAALAEGRPVDAATWVSGDDGLPGGISGEVRR